jgi:hypothetical protein
MEAHESTSHSELKKLSVKKARLERIRLVLLQALSEGLTPDGHVSQHADFICETPLSVKLRRINDVLEETVFLKAVDQERLAVTVIVIEEIRHEREQLIAVLSISRKRRELMNRPEALQGKTSQ